VLMADGGGPRDGCLERRDARTEPRDAGGKTGQADGCMLYYMYNGIRQVVK